MALSKQYVVVPGTLPKLFQKIREGQAPSKFTSQHLKDIGFNSGNHRPFIPLLKSLGFLSDSGEPTARYHDYRDQSNSKRVMGEALRETYHDLFVIKSKPTDADKDAIVGKFKSAHNVKDELAERMYATFMSLLKMADLEGGSSAAVKKDKVKKQDEEEAAVDPRPAEIHENHQDRIRHRPGLYYNIQIHLPATKDIEVYNAIFRSLKEHLVD